jgi:heme A synthase
VELAQPALKLIIFTVFQVTLGALTVLSHRQVWINSLHVVCGALVLTTSLVITLRSWHILIADCGSRIADLKSIDPQSIRIPQSAIRNQEGRA